MKPCKNLRQYISRLSQAGEVREIKARVDWNLEIGAIMRRANDLMAPAPLFRNIKDYPGFSLLGSPVSGSARKNAFYSRVAISLGLPPESGAATVIETLASFFKCRRIPPKIVADAPCKQNRFIGDKADIFRLPIPYLHDGDGARYVGTWHTVVTRTPDGRWTNWGMYRIAAHGRRTMGGPMMAAQHIGMHLQEWRKVGKPMPFAVVIGSDPVTPLIASMSLPADVNEADVLGGYLGRPVELVNCETVDLRVPASAEIVIEGEIPLCETHSEGPFGEYTGFMTAGESPKPVYKVSAVTFRDDPIFTSVCPGVPVEDHLSMSLSIAGEVLFALRKRGVPVKAVNMPPCSAMHFLVVAVDMASYKGRSAAREVGEVIRSVKSSILIPKVIVVDGDTNVFNLNEVVWNLGTKCHPENGAILYRNTKIFPLFPFLTPAEKKAQMCTTVVYDCIWPGDWPKAFVPRRASFDSLWSLKIRSKVLRNWTKYGYKPPGGKKGGR